MPVNMSAAPSQMIARGEKRFVHAVASGAPIVMKAAPSVPIRSMAAGEALVNGLFGVCAMLW